jgi:hypothetical protein
MDFPYLRRVTQLNIATIAALARAPAPPEPQVEGAVSTDTTLSWWGPPGASSFVAYWRRTDSSQWEHMNRGAGIAISSVLTRTPSGGRSGSVHYQAVLPHVRVDDWVFGVSAVAADGSESPVASAVPGGAFVPYVPPPPAARP